METNSFAVQDAQFVPGARLADRILFTEEMHLSAFLRDSRDFLFGDLAVEDVAELMSEMDFGSVRQYIRTMGVDVKKLVHAAKLMKSETGFSPRLLTRREKAELAAGESHLQFRTAVTREHHGEISLDDGCEPDWDLMALLGDTELSFGNTWWRKNVTMKPFIKQGKMLSGIRVSFDKKFDRFILLSDMKFGEVVMLENPKVLRFRELWENEPDRLAWFRHKGLWAAAMEIEVVADPRTGKRYTEPKVAHMWAYLSKSSTDNEKAVKAVKAIAFKQRQKKPTAKAPSEAESTEVPVTKVNEQGETWVVPRIL